VIFPRGITGDFFTYHGAISETIWQFIYLVRA
jgi:hypothetical protein